MRETIYGTCRQRVKFYIKDPGTKTNKNLSILDSLNLKENAYLKIKMLSMLNVDSQLQLMMLRMENARF